MDGGPSLWSEYVELDPPGVIVVLLVMYNTC